MIINKKIKRQLEAIDWDFPVSLAGFTKTPHWYPGTFPPFLPATLIQALTKPNEIVFDPYGGIGTTASEAIRLGRKAWVVDINPVGVLSNYVYCGLIILKRKSPQNLNLFFEYILDQLADYDSSYSRLDLVGITLDGLQIDSILSAHMRPQPKEFFEHIDAKPPSWYELERWYHPKTLKTLKRMYTSSEDQFTGYFLKAFLLVMLSANLRVLSSQNKSWGHVADNVYPKEHIHKDVYGHLRNWLNILKNSIARLEVENRYPMNGIRYWAQIHDWRSTERIQVKPNGGANIIVTSPPYGDAIDYILSQKLSLYYLGYSENQVSALSNREIGARRRRTKSGSREKWAVDMAESAANQLTYLSGGLFVNILPHKNHGREMGIATMVERLELLGWECVLKIDRSISQQKSRQFWTSIKQETINIFSKKE